MVNIRNLGLLVICAAAAARCHDKREQLLGKANEAILCKCYQALKRHSQLGHGYSTVNQAGKASMFIKATHRDNSLNSIALRQLNAGGIGLPWLVLACYPFSKPHHVVQTHSHQYIYIQIL